MPADPGYDAAFFRYVNATATSAAEVVAPLLIAALSPKSVLDVGCGQGAWLAVWRRLGVSEVMGLDGEYVDRSHLLVPAQCFQARDLAIPFDLGRRFSLVQCLEVAEHLPASSAAPLIQSLVRHGEVVLFSAAPPGQGGHDHLNERSYDDWREEFRAHDYLALDYLRPRIRHARQVAAWYRYNPLLYVHRRMLAELPAILLASRLAETAPVPDLAPAAYRLRRQIVRRLPVAAMTALARLKERLRRSHSPP